MENTRVNASPALTLMLALAVLLLAGCATPVRRARQLVRIEPAGLTNLGAYVESTNIEILWHLHGLDHYAHAAWPEAASATQSNEFHSYYATLAFGHQPRTARKSIVKHSDKIALRGAGEWRSVVSNVLAGLTPRESGHGVLALIQGEEIALYRDHQAQPHVSPLALKPADILIDKAYGENDFVRDTLRAVGARAGLSAPPAGELLFATEDEPAFVLVNPKQKSMVFLSYPNDTAPPPTDIPGWFALRTLHSVIVRGLLISALKNPVTTVGRGLWHLVSSGSAALDSVSGVAPTTPAPLNTGPGMDLAKWEKKLDGVVSSRRSQGKVEFLIGGEKFFPALIQSIENARHSVDVLVYIFSGDPYAVTIADILKQRSADIRVRVLMDELGCLFGNVEAPASATPPGFRPPDDIKSYLRDGSAVRVRESANPWLTSDHRKCIIIDEQQAFLGGMNIGWNYRYDWHDMMVRVTGPVVGRMEKDYEEAWAHAGPGGDLAYALEALFGRTHRRRLELVGEIDIRPLRTATGHQEILRAQLAAIKNAKSYIYVENPYFSDYSLLRELIKARERGVDVRVVLPSRNDSGVMQTGNLVMANAMLAGKVRVFIYPGMTHTKAAIYDGWVCLGSANMEKMSLRVSQELDIAFSDPAAAATLKHDLFEADFARSREMTRPVPMTWIDSIVQAFAGQI